MHQKKTRKTVAVAFVTLMAVTMLGLAPSMAHAGPMSFAICMLITPPPLNAILCAPSFVLPLP